MKGVPSMSIADLIVGVAFLVLLLVVVIAALCKSAGDYDGDENKYWKDGPWDK